MAHPGVSWKRCGGGVSTCAQHLCWEVGDGGHGAGCTGPPSLQEGLELLP